MSYFCDPLKAMNFMTFQNVKGNLPSLHIVHCHFVIDIYSKIHSKQCFLTTKPQRSLVMHIKHQLDF